MSSDEYRQLQRLGGLIEQLGYAVELLAKSEQVPVDMLSLQLEEDAKGRPQFLTLAVYPLEDELDAASFLQFYFQYPFQVRAERRNQVMEALATTNQQLPLGHFNISNGENTLYFKYVLAVPRGQAIEASFLNDVLDMCLFTQEHYLDHLEALA